MGDFCGRAEASSFTAVLDFTWGGWSGVETKAKNAGFPYIRYGQFVLCCLTPLPFQMVMKPKEGASNQILGRPDR